MGLRVLKLATKVLNQNMIFETVNFNPRVLKNTGFKKFEQ